MLSLLIFGGSAVYFGWALADEPHFVDESAYIAQAFYGDLYVTGQWDHPAWLDYAGYDLPPLAKYLICLGLGIEAQRRPTLTDAHAWYANTSRQFVGRAGLVAARRPMVLLGAVGCAAIFGVGVLTGSERVGLLAALLLAVNPLYLLHARRAMSEIPTESFTLLALVSGLVLYRGAEQGRQRLGWWGLVGLAGVLVGLATLSKLNGVLGGLVLAGWVGLGLVAGTMGLRSKVALGAALGLAGLIAFGTFVVLNPFLTAHPPRPVAASVAEAAQLGFAGRVATVFDHRASISKRAMTMFPNDALPTLPSRLAVVVAQGFGRFGPLGRHGWSDSTRRFDWDQDRGALVWFPVVVAGLVLLARRGLQGRARGVADYPWLVLTYYLVIAAVVTAFIPLAWDRYLISIQAPAALVGAVVLVAGWDAGVRRLQGRGTDR